MNYYNALNKVNYASIIIDHQIIIGVDPLSTFVYLMVPSKKRDSVAWWMAYLSIFELRQLFYSF
jgi:hypothetical protein